MASWFTRAVLRPLFRLSDRVGFFFARLWQRHVIRELGGTVTDGFLELLLRAMGFAFELSPAYRRNIEGFEGVLLFTAGDGVAASATFQNGQMTMGHEHIDHPNAQIAFRDPAALRAYLLSGGQDILQAILENKVETKGNLNYIYRFGFLARDLARRLGVG